MKFVNPVKNKGARAFVFYAAFLLACCLLEKAVPSGPCNPGLGIMLFLLLPWIIVALLAVNTVKLYRGKTGNRLPLFIHAGALIVYALFFYFKIL